MLFLDMDGVVAIHEPLAYPENNEKPLFLERGYFASLSADEFIKRLIHLLHLNNMEFAILSTVCSTEEDKEAKIPIADKIEWLKTNFKGFDAIPEQNMLFSIKGVTNKAQIAQNFLNRPINESDILVDDFNAELSAWQKAGGTAVKYINGANNYNSWAGKCITKPLSFEETAKYDVDFLKKVESDALENIKLPKKRSK